MEKAREVLAQFIGPIANMLVKRSAAGMTNLERFHQTLANELDRDERDDFLRRLKD